MFGHFTGLADLKATNPLMLYFYWPEDDAESKDKGVANQVRRCKLMDEILASEEVRRASVLFHSLKCNIKEVSEELKKKYNIVFVPKVMFFDVRGKKAWQLTSTTTRPGSVAKKMRKIAHKCKKLLEKMNK